MNERKRNNSGLFIIIIMLLVIIIALGCVIGYLLLGGNEKKEIKDNNTVEVEKEETETDVVEVSDYTPKYKFVDKTYKTDVDVSKYNNIFEYISNQDNVSIKLDYCLEKKVYDANGIASDGYDQKVYNFTSDEIKTILNEAKQSKIQIHTGGIGAACPDVYTINYSRNSANHYIKIFSTIALLESDDGNIFKIMDTYSELEQYSNAGEISPEQYMYGIQNLSSTLEAKSKELHA